LIFSKKDGVCALQSGVPYVLMSHTTWWIVRALQLP